MNKFELNKTLIPIAGNRKSRRTASSQREERKKNGTLVEFKATKQESKYYQKKAAQATKLKAELKPLSLELARLKKKYPNGDKSIDCMVAKISEKKGKLVALHQFLTRLKTTSDAQNTRLYDLTMTLQEIQQNRFRPEIVAELKEKCETLVKEASFNRAFYESKLNLAVLGRLTVDEVLQAEEYEFGFAVHRPPYLLDKNIVQFGITSIDNNLDNLDETFQQLGSSEIIDVKSNVRRNFETRTHPDLKPPELPDSEFLNLRYPVVFTDLEVVATRGEVEFFPPPTPTEIAPSVTTSALGFAFGFKELFSIVKNRLKSVYNMIIK